MTRAFEFTKGLLTGVNNTPLPEPTGKKLYTFENGILVEVKETNITSGGRRNFEFQNGILVHPGNVTPNPVGDDGAYRNLTNPSSHYSYFDISETPASIVSQINSPIGGDNYLFGDHNTTVRNTNIRDTTYESMPLGGLSVDSVPIMGEGANIYYWITYGNTEVYLVKVDFNLDTISSEILYQLDDNYIYNYNGKILGYGATSSGAVSFELYWTYIYGMIYNEKFYIVAVTTGILVDNPENKGIIMTTTYNITDNEKNNCMNIWYYPGLNYTSGIEVDIYVDGHDAWWFGQDNYLCLGFSFYGYWTDYNLTEGWGQATWGLLFVDLEGGNRSWTMLSYRQDDGNSGPYQWYLSGVTKKDSNDNLYFYVTIDNFDDYNDLHDVHAIAIPEPTGEGEFFEYTEFSVQDQCFPYFASNENKLFLIEAPIGWSESLYTIPRPTDFNVYEIDGISNTHLGYLNDDIIGWDHYIPRIYPLISISPRPSISLRLTSDTNSIILYNGITTKKIIKATFVDGNTTPLTEDIVTMSEADKYDVDSDSYFMLYGNTIRTYDGIIIIVPGQEYVDPTQG